MAKKLVYLFLIMISLSSQSIWAQCGTLIPRNHIMHPRVLPVTAKSEVTYNLNRTLSVNVHIVASAFNTYDFSTTDYQPIWDELNILFEPINLSFQICNEVLIPNYNYNIITTNIENNTEPDEEDSMLAEYYIPNVINVYYVESIESDLGFDPAGYAAFPGGQDIIVLTKASGIWTLAHEMGHFFGLYHTFETDFGLEFVNGGNCETTGDLVCDTPADDNGDVEECTYADVSTDGNGDPYSPYINNIMSYYPDECICKFTPGQYNRMAWMYLSERNYLW